MDLLENSFLGSGALWPGRIARTNCAESKECRLNAIVKGELDARRNEVSIFIDIARIEPLFFILEVERMQDEIVSVPSPLLTPVLAVTAREDAAINNDVGHEEESEGVQERMRRSVEDELTSTKASCTVSPADPGIRNILGGRRLDEEA
ncbi:hypothetical protein HZH66_009656 [Vespula vulgaris]|uniref:Uncharacterized protein n=1 Tax=Vespula vulgaris TaxID=7454 RepID=A0A834JME0_VESVU|nr:hypothetical protein HZH66_009656 [Vespula vulgaris]